MMMMAMNTQQIGEGGDQQEQLKCPRCESTNTKFCYYNNYNLSQPRHFCKSCRRYWTVGGALRNIPFGGATRKPHRPSSTSSNSKRLPKPSQPAPASTSKIDDEQRALSDACVLPGTFSSLLTTEGQLGSLVDSMFSGGHVAVPSVQFGEFSADGGGFNSDVEMGEVGCWGGVNGWADLALYPPGLSFDQ